jgi:hypothetical protein
MIVVPFFQLCDHLLSDRAVMMLRLNGGDAQARVGLIRALTRVAQALPCLRCGLAPDTVVIHKGGDDRTDGIELFELQCRRHR